MCVAVHFSTLLKLFEGKATDSNEAAMCEVIGPEVLKNGPKPQGTWNTSLLETIAVQKDLKMTHLC